MPILRLPVMLSFPLDRALMGTLTFSLDPSPTCPGPRLFRRTPSRMASARRVYHRLEDLFHFRGIVVDLYISGSPPGGYSPQKEPDRFPAWAGLAGILCTRPKIKHSISTPCFRCEPRRRDRRIFTRHSISLTRRGVSSPAISAYLVCQLLDTHAKCDQECLKA